MEESRQANNDTHRDQERCLDAGKGYQESPSDQRAEDPANTRQSKILALDCPGRALSPKRLSKSMGRSCPSGVQVSEPIRKSR